LTLPARPPTFAVDAKQTNKAPAITVPPAGSRKADGRGTFRNPLKPVGPDPWLTYDDGWYYLSTTTGASVKMRRAKHLAELKDAPDVVVWKDDDASRNRQVWAPEFHRIPTGKDAQKARWYLYYTASDGVGAHHRMYVAESAGVDPMGPYTFKAKLQTDPEDAFFAIDGSVLRLPDGALYFLWCGRPAPTGQGVYLSRMANPWTLTGARVHLPAGGFGCSEVREAPVTLVRDKKVLLFYSACDTGKPDYKLGLLTADVHSDLMNPASWKQHPTPVFTRADRNGVFGPGHNFFFTSPDGKEDWIVYHAKTTSAYTYAGRSTRAQPFTWNPDGTPNLGSPRALYADIPVPSGETVTGHK
jgi:GH43 family beta-xylosidase